MSPRAQASGRVWAGLAGGLAAGSLLAWWLPAAWLDWQPALAATQPWRAFSAAWVHWSERHLVANLIGTVVVAALGLVARLPTRAALAWAAAWPLTQLGLLMQPALAHFGGLSGVLHAGVAVAALWLVCRRRGLHRFIAAGIGAGLLMKVLLEEPWGTPLRDVAGWDIATAPLAHASGVAAGVICAALALVLEAGQSRR